MRVGVVGNPRYDDLRGRLTRLAALAPSFGFTLLPEAELVPVWPGDATPLDLDEAPPDVVLCFGGDGTLLRTARIVGRRQIPLLGVNVGRVGFLTTATPETLEEALGALAEGRYSLEMRRTLATTIMDGHGRERAGETVLNDVVVHKGGVARVIRLHVMVDDETLGTFSADGVIVATPTGTTAYSLSAGGPVVVPGVDALAVTPICPHTLAVRPVVVAGESRIVIDVLPPRGEDGVIVSYDGQVGTTLADDDRVIITRSPVLVRLVRIGTEGFFTRMRRKLQWGGLPDRERT